MTSNTFSQANYYLKFFINFEKYGISHKQAS